MAYNGIEIDMLTLGDADSILVTHWFGGYPTRVLIDGGNRDSSATVRAFLQGQSVRFLDDVVCTHPHADHAGGLIDLLADNTLAVGKLWMHDPAQHGDLTPIRAAIAGLTDKKRAAKIEESLTIGNELRAVCARRGISVEEPFFGRSASFLTVCGPSQEYYEELVPKFSDSETLKSIESTQIQDLAEEILVNLPSNGRADSLEANPQTTPENNSSVILATAVGTSKFLFTADAGAPALLQAASRFALANCAWMQVPHHGSRRNITNALIEHFRPGIAYISAAGNLKHPRRAVVNALKSSGSAVYSTHYPSTTNLWHHEGIVPSRPRYGIATSLYNASAKRAVPA